MENDYYVKRKGKLLRKYRQMMATARPVLAARYDAAMIEAITAVSQTEFERLIPQIPYIGGRQNNFTGLLVELTVILALYRALKQQDRPLAEIGEVTQQIAKKHINQFPPWLPRLAGRLYLSHFWQRHTEKRARQSQKRQYPGDFVYEVVPGDGQNYAWGVNYLECAIVKFFVQQGAAEFTPFVCEIDFLLFPAMGIELKRSGTIGQGCSHCDFRFQKID